MQVSWMKTSVTIRTSLWWSSCLTFIITRTSPDPGAVFIFYICARSKPWIVLKNKTFRKFQINQNSGYELKNKRVLIFSLIKIHTRSILLYYALKILHSRLLFSFRINFTLSTFPYSSHRGCSKVFCFFPVCQHCQLGVYYGKINMRSSSSFLALLKKTPY